MKSTNRFVVKSFATRCMLVLLRLAIGWHLFIEGASKLETFAVGPTGTSKPFSSRGYLQQSQGPLAPYFHSLAGDPDQQLVARLQDGSEGSLPVLKQEWTDYVDRYSKHYKLDESQKTKAQELLKQHFDKLVQWHRSGTKSVSRDYSFTTITPTLTTPQRIEEYKSKLNEYRNKIDGWNLRFEKDVTKARIATLRGDIAKLRVDLQKDLDEQQEKLRQELDKLLSKDQIKIDFDQYVIRLMRAAASPGYTQDNQAVAELVQAVRDSKNAKISDEHWQSLPRYPEGFFYAMSSDPELSKVLYGVCKRNVGPPLRVEDTRMLDIADHTVAWGLTLAGLGLLLGCFTRFSCLVGAILLLLFYLALPPLPGLPDNPMVEGKYLFVNKNLIEVLALLVLATTASGRWLGIDGLLSNIVPFKYLWPATKPTTLTTQDSGLSTQD